MMLCEVGFELGKVGKRVVKAVCGFLQGKVVESCMRLGDTKHIWLRQLAKTKTHRPTSSHSKLLVLMGEDGSGW